MIHVIFTEMKFVVTQKLLCV